MNPNNEFCSLGGNIISQKSVFFPKWIPCYTLSWMESGVTLFLEENFQMASCMFTTLAGFYTAIRLTNHTVSPHAIYFWCTIHYKLCHTGQIYFWIKLNYETITNQKKICSKQSAELKLWNTQSSLCIGTVVALTVSWAASVAKSSKDCLLNFQSYDLYNKQCLDN